MIRRAFVWHDHRPDFHCIQQREESGILRFYEEILIPPLKHGAEGKQKTDLPSGYSLMGISGIRTLDICNFHPSISTKFLKSSSLLVILPRPH